MDPEQAYRRYYPLVLQHARRVLGDGVRAQDVAQETFLRFLGAKVVGGDAGALAWLYRTTGNLAIDAIRTRGRLAALSPLAPAPAPEVSEARASLRSTIERLGERVPREILRAGLLCRANGLTHGELAEILEVSERTVRRWLTTFDDEARQFEETTR